MRSPQRPRRRVLATVLAPAAAAAVAMLSTGAGDAQAQNTMGLDTSSATGVNPSPAQWNAAFSQGFRFAILRSSRGGLTAANGRVDDSHFYDSINEATTAGLLAGSYHFARPDLSPTASPATGTNTGAEDAQHYLQQAGMYMKPGYLIPVFDLEGTNNMTPAQLTAWSDEWIDTIFAATGFNPIVYTSSSYNNDEVQASLAWNNTGSTPKTDPRTYQWLARPDPALAGGAPNPLWGNSANRQPEPAAVYPNPYGVWDPNFITRTNSRDPAVNPWVFWQESPTTTPAGLFPIDYDYANGNIEFVKDFLVPALWTNAGSGDWGTVSNWNSNNPGHIPGNFSTGPASRLPNNSSLDWVKLQNAGDGTVTISSGARSVRKFYTQQQLDINGGSLSISYTPGAGGKWDVPSEFNAVVNLATGAAYHSHTTQVDGGNGQFNLNGGTVTFRDMQLVSHASNPGKLVINGDVTLGQTVGSGTSVIRSTGALAQAGSVEITAGDRTVTVNNGTAALDLNIRTAVTGAGRLIKAGPGTMQLSNANTFSGGTTVSAGVLQIAADNRLGAVPGSVDSDNIALNGGVLRTGAQINSVALTNAGSGYTSFPALTINGGGANVQAASANVLANITSIAVTNGGSNYVNQLAGGAPPAAGTAGTFVDIIGGGGTGATARATVSGGVVTAINIVTPGTGYTSMPTIHISSTISGGSLAGSGAVASVNGITLTGLTLNDGGFDYTSPTISLTGGGGSGATASATPTPDITLAANRGIDLGNVGGTLFQTAGTTLTVNGNITSAGNGSLTKDGPGTLTLNGSGSNYGGATVINQGTVNASTPTSIGNDTGSLSVNNTSAGSGTAVVLNLSAAGPTTKGTLAGDITNPGGGNTATINNFGQMFTVKQLADGTYEGVIAGGGGFTLGASSIATLTLSGANTYTGGTFVDGGTLALGANNALADTGDVTVNGGTFNISSFNDTVDAVTLVSGNLNGSGGTLTGSSYDVRAGTISAQLAGSGALTKTTAGTVTLSGAVSYTGDTNVNAGTLALVSGASLVGAVNVGGGVFDIGTISDTVGAVSMTSGAIIGTTGTLTGSGYAVESGTISAKLAGTGALTKTTAGTVTLSGAASYTGDTNVNGGTFALSTGGSLDNSGAVNVNGGTFDIGSVSDTVGAVTLTSGAITGTGGTLTSPSYAVEAGTITARLAGPGALTKTTGGTVSLSNITTYSGGTNVNAGTLALLTGAALANSGAVNVNGGTFDIGTVSDQVGVVTLTSGTITGSTGTLTGSSYAVQSGGIAAKLAGVGIALTKTNVGTVTLAAPMSYTGGTNVNAGTLALTAGGSLADTGAINVNGGTFDIGAVSDTVGGVTLTSGTITGSTGVLDAANYLVHAGNISAPLAGGGDLDKINAGTVNVSSALSYTGATNVNQGTLALLTGGSLPDGGAVNVQGGTLDIGANSDTVGPVTLVIGSITGSTGTLTGSSYLLQSGTASAKLGGSGALTKSSPSTVTLSGANTYTGGTTVDGGLLIAQGSSALGATTNPLAANNPNTGAGNNVELQLSTTAPTTVGSLSGAIALAGSGNNGVLISNGDQLFTVNQTTPATFEGVIQGAGGFTLGALSTSTLTLTGLNGWTGPTTISAGTLRGNTDSLPSSITNDAALVFDQTFDGNFSKNITGTGSVTKIGAGTLTLSAANSWSGGTTVSAGTLKGMTSNLPGNILNNAAVVFDQLFTGTYAGNMTGSGSLTKLNGGVLTLSGTNSYGGGTTVTGGTLRGTTASLQGNITNNAAVTFDQSTTGNYSGNMSGSGSLTKSGSGTVNLTGNNTYTGATTVDGGTLSSTNGFKTGNTLTILSAAKAVVPEVAPSTYNPPGTVPAGSNATTSKISALSISGSGQLDLGNSDMVIDHAGGLDIQAFRELLRTGYNDTGWDGPGIVSTTALNTDPFIFAIGYADNALLDVPFGSELGGDPFSGVDVDESSLLIKFTWIGDCNLDGKVDSQDLGIFGGYDGGVATDRTWQQGDFNYDGKTDGQDLALFNTNYNPDKPSLPEPGGAGLLLGAASMLIARRRRANRN